jgi:uncharacterized iron-regulated membrane protein
VNRPIITFLTGGGPVTPRYAERAPIITPAPGPRLGPDAALAIARQHTSEPIVLVLVPGRPDQPIRVTPSFAGSTPIYVDPYRGAVLASASPPPTRVDNVQRMMGRLHEAIALGPVYTVLVFLSGLVPLVFFVTGLIMWLKKRQNRLAMNQPLPQLNEV